MYGRSAAYTRCVVYRAVQMYITFTLCAPISSSCSPFRLNENGSVKLCNYAIWHIYSLWYIWALTHNNTKIVGGKQIVSMCAYGAAGVCCVFAIFFLRSNQNWWHLEATETETDSGHHPNKTHFSGWIVIPFNAAPFFFVALSHHPCGLCVCVCLKRLSPLRCLAHCVW